LQELAVEQSVELDTAIEVVRVESDSLLNVDEDVEKTDIRTQIQPPEFAAANAVESGGGAFYPWLTGLLLLLRRKV